VATIETERLILRPPEERDVAAIARAIEEDPDIAWFIPLMPTPYTEADARAWLAGIPERLATISETPFAITERGADELIGSISVRLHAQGSIGYWLRESSRGQGLMTEAVIAVVRWAAVEHGLHDLHLTTHPDNLASQRVAEQAGFVRGGMVMHEPPFGDGGMRALRYERPR
jgi:RimJ/RimL family protein N-acetyltransferase